MEEMMIDNVTTEETTDEVTTEEKDEGGSTLGSMVFVALIGVCAGVGSEVGKFAFHRVLAPGAKKIAGLFKNRKNKKSEETKEDTEDYLTDDNDEFEPVE